MDPLPRPSGALPRTSGPPLPLINNVSLALVSYQVDFSVISEIQNEERYNSTLTSSAAAEAAIVTNLEKQFAALKELFIANAKCDKCGKCSVSPLVMGSKHEAFGVDATDEIWNDLVEHVDGNFTTLSSL